MVQMMFLPGQRAQFATAELAERTEYDESVVETVLNRFSVGFSERDLDGRVPEI
jgi:hypothetical protein